MRNVNNFIYLTKIDCKNELPFKLAIFHFQSVMTEGRVNFISTIHTQQLILIYIAKFTTASLLFDTAYRSDNVYLTSCQLEFSQTRRNWQ